MFFPQASMQRRRRHWGVSRAAGIPEESVLRSEECSTNRGRRRRGGACDRREGRVGRDSAAPRRPRHLSGCRVPHPRGVSLPHRSHTSHRRQHYSEQRFCRRGSTLPILFF
ncbi:unnamed protein product, partial [Ectocarpus sp. 6 AP-2014]